MYKETDVLSIFDSIAYRYDLLNHILSSGIDVLWRRKAVRLLRPFRPDRILDVATGTGDLAIEAAGLSPKQIIGLDTSTRMLEIARKKIYERGLESIIKLESGRAEKLPFKSNSFDAVMSAFGVRNFSDLRLGLQEFIRVLRNGGTAMILEFSTPQRFPVKQAYRFYSRHLLPLIGGLVSKNRPAYEYLTETSSNFPYGRSFCDILASVGFKDVTCYQLTFGVASIYFGKKEGTIQ